MDGAINLESEMDTSYQQYFPEISTLIRHSQYIQKSSVNKIHCFLMSFDEQMFRVFVDSCLGCFQNFSACVPFPVEGIENDLDEKGQL